MLKRLLLLLLLTCGFAVPLLAATPTTILLEANISVLDTPLNGVHRVTARLYDDATFTNWEEVHTSVTFNEGVGEIELGSVETLTNSLLDLSTPNLILEIEGEEIEIPLYSSFYAMKAKTTDHVAFSNVEGGDKPTLKTLLFTEVNKGSAATSLVVDWTTGSKQKVTLTGDVSTVTFTPPAGSGHLMLIITQDSTGGHSITWPSSIKWPSGVQPELTSDGDAIDIVTLYYDSSSESYLGSASFDFQ